MELRINKFIANSGVCSRRSADNLVLDGRVKVNGQVVTELGLKITEDDIVEIDNKNISLEKNKVYIMLNKPRGYVTTAKEQFSRPSVLDLITCKERIFPVGRLDMDSEGLLLLTNDGAFTNQIIHPTKHIAKKYEVVLKYNVSDEDIQKLSQGIEIDGYITKPAIVKMNSSKTLTITIYEGKNRQIRKMCEAIGNKVITLKRVAIGHLTLGKLGTGEYKFLTVHEIERIFHST